MNDQILPTFTMDRRYVGRPVICLRRVYSLLRIVTALISNVPVLALHLADTDADTFLASHPPAAGHNQMIICPLIYTQCVRIGRYSFSQRLINLLFLSNSFEHYSHYVVSVCRANYFSVSLIPSGDIATLVVFSMYDVLSIAAYEVHYII